MFDKVKFTPARAQAAAEQLERLIGAMICRRRMEAEGADDELLGIQDEIILDDLDEAVAAWTGEEPDWEFPKVLQPDDDLINHPPAVTR